MKTQRVVSKMARLLAGGVLAAAVGSGAYAGIADTKHNLGTSANAGAGPLATFSGTTEICVFCHTPHGSDTSAAAPLWNRNITSPPAYQTYADLNTTTYDAGQHAIGSVSLACLSCHDGTQAMNTIENAPGSGLAGDAAWTAGAWSAGTGQITAANGYGATAIGTDLRNDHPVSIPYAGGGVNATGTQGAYPLADADFKQAAGTELGRATVNNQEVWWVEMDGDSTRDKTDLQLYTRALATVDTAFVECATCHDPHSENTTFLRPAGGNTGSQLCLACHDK